MPNVLSSAGRAYGGPGGSPYAESANYTTSAPGGGRDILARLLAGAGAQPPPIPQELLNPAQPPPIPPELLNPAAQQQPPPIPQDMLTADFPNGVPAGGTPFPAAAPVQPPPIPQELLNPAPAPAPASPAPAPSPPLARAAGTDTAGYEPRSYQKKPKKKGQYKLKVEQGN